MASFKKNIVVVTLYSAGKLCSSGGLFGSIDVKLWELYRELTHDISTLAAAQCRLPGREQQRGCGRVVELRGRAAAAAAA